MKKEYFTNFSKCVETVTIWQKMNIGGKLRNTKQGDLKTLIFTVSKSCDVCHFSIELFI